MIKLSRKPNARTSSVEASPSGATQTPTAPSLPRVPAHREERFFTVKQLAARWQISERQVHRFIQSGALVASKFGRSLRLAERDVLLFEHQCR